MSGIGFDMAGAAPRRRGRRSLQFLALGAMILCGLAVMHASVQGQGTSPVVPVARIEQSQLDQPLSWLLEAKRNYSAVKDYSCTLVSRENVRGKLQDENIILLKMKTQPFSVYMRWLAPKSYQGQEVAFVLGKNNNKMRVKSNMVGKNIIGFMSIDPNDARVLEHSRHNIYEAGIGNMIERTIGHWETERKFGRVQVRVNSDFTYNQRECYRVETIRPERNPDSYCYRCVLYLEKSSKMPIRLENYDWPRSNASAEGELMESFSYVNLQFNTGLRDEEFNK